MKNEKNQQLESEDILNNNEEIISDAESITDEKIVVFSRDWTIETMVNQIDQGNIDLDPEFQRRNAWKDEKKSKLIESYILDLPVPEIVLAENPKKPKAFIIIDGKQRLLSIIGYINPKKYPYWKDAQLQTLRSRSDLNGISYQQMNENPKYTDDVRLLLNSDIRCTVISNFKRNDILYDIFYRLNTGSVPLSTQELRQVLNKGPFAKYLLDITKELNPLHVAMGLEEPDPRLYDVEFILRFIVFKIFGYEYTGNLKKFLDEFMGTINDEWDKYKDNVQVIVDSIYCALENLKLIFDETEIGRRYSNNKYFPKYNKVILEAQLFYFSKIERKRLTKRKNLNFKKEYEKLCANKDFLQAISGSTKDIAKYRSRYISMRNIINSTYNLDLTEIIVKE